MDTRLLFYYSALSNLQRSARQFAQDIIAAAEQARRIEGDDCCDDSVAIETFRSCHKSLMDAFLVAPGMVQLFTGTERR